MRFNLDKNNYKKSKEVVKEVANPKEVELAFKVAKSNNIAATTLTIQTQVVVACNKQADLPFKNVLRYLCIKTTPILNAIMKKKKLLIYFVFFFLPLSILK